MVYRFPLDSSIEENLAVAIKVNLFLARFVHRFFLTAPLVRLLVVRTAFAQRNASSSSWEMPRPLQTAITSAP
jgi:hypothetical protein